MKFEFNYNPEGKKRPRFGANGKVYDPQTSSKMKFKWDAGAQKRSQSSERPLESPLHVGMRFHVPMPKSWSQKRKKEHFQKPCTSKPDVDNQVKFILDVLNGIAYSDDKFVTRGWFEKVWDYTGKSEVFIEEKDKTLIEDLQILEEASVKMHLALSRIYSLVQNYSEAFDTLEMLCLCENIEMLCLEAGLDEIIQEDE